MSFQSIPDYILHVVPWIQENLRKTIFIFAFELCSKALISS